MTDCKFHSFNAGGPYNYVVINYDGKWGFACDWGDCLEEIHFIYGYEFLGAYIEYDDPKLISMKTIMVEND